MKRKITLKKVFILIACIAVCVAIAMTIPRFFKSEEAVAAQTSTVEIEHPIMGTISNSDELIGTIEYETMTEVYPKMNGEILTLNVKEGSQVAAGSVICTIENTQLDSMSASVNSAKLTLDDAQNNLARIQTLYEGGAASSESYDQAVSQVEAAQIQYDSALTNYNTQAQYSTVTAPVSGRVEVCNVEAHEMASAANPICILSSGNNKIASFFVTERIANNLSIGTKVVLEKSGTQYNAQIYDIAATVDEETGLFKIKAKISGGNKLAVNASVKVNLVAEESGNTLTIPINAVYYDGGDAFVYTYSNGTVHKQPIETGLYDAERMEVLSGLTIDDQVVKTWSSTLRDGATVELSASQSGHASLEEEKDTADQAKGGN